MDNYINSITQNTLSGLSGANITSSSRALANVAPKDAGEAAKEFESMFLTQMLRPMFDSIEKNELFGGGYGEEVWKDLLVDQYGKILAERGNLGVSDAIKSELLKLQEISDAG